MLPRPGDSTVQLADVVATRRTYGTVVVSKSDVNNFRAKDGTGIYASVYY